MASRVCQGPAYSVIEVTHFILTLSLAELLSFCAHGTWWTLLKWNGRWQWAFLLQISSAMHFLHDPIEIHLQNKLSKINYSELNDGNRKTVYKALGPFWVPGLVWLHWWKAHEPTFLDNGEMKDKNILYKYSFYSITHLANSYEIPTLCQALP